MKYIILILSLTACTAPQLNAQSAKEDIIEAYLEDPERKCDQQALDAYSAEIGAYEITCEELEEL